MPLASASLMMGASSRQVASAALMMSAALAASPLPASSWVTSCCGQDSSVPQSSGSTCRRGVAICRLGQGRASAHATDPLPLVQLDT